MSFIEKATALVTTGLKASSAVNLIKGGIPQTFQPLLGKTSGEQGRNVRGLPNDLEQFASYTYLFTFSALTSRQFNTPASYRNSPSELKHIVFASAGRYDSQRTVIEGGRKPEYFVDNFQIASVISASQKTGNSNAISYSFEVFEPYSMGLFLQSLQLAALDSGAKSYLQAPYVLKVDFLGFTDDGKLFQGIASKYFTVKLKKVTFDTNESGSNYKVECIPYNHQGYSNTIDTAFTDIAIFADKGKPVTVKHLLSEGENSLCAVMNRRQEVLVASNKITYPDEYVIEFPESVDQLINREVPDAPDSATITPDSPPARSVGSEISRTIDYGNSAIGNADMGITAESGGNYTFTREEDSIDAKTGVIQRNSMIIDPKNRKFHFPQKEKLTHIITQIILSSQYATDAITKDPDAQGFIDWFKIDIQFQLKEFDDKRGEYAKKIIFRVLPYKVNVSIFSNPTSAVPGYQELEKIIAKQYQYIYTGQNNDIIKFDIQINNLFFSGTNPSPEIQSGTAANVSQVGIGEKNPDKTSTPTGPSGDAAVASNTGSAAVKPDPSRLSDTPNPKGHETSAELVAKSFHQAFLNNSSDMINIDLEVIGDLYWVIDSGIGNYFSSKSDTGKQINKDGSANYEGSDVYIYISFRTPTDINERNGLYDFPNGGKESPFSGIYKVVRCDNTFNSGTFTQKLKCIRLPKQAKDFDNAAQPTDTGTLKQVNVEGEAPSKSNIQQEITEPGYGLL